MTENNCFDRDRCDCVDGIETLQKIGLLDRFNLNIIINYPKSAEGFVACMKTLKKRGILNDYYKNIILEFVTASERYIAKKPCINIDTVEFHFRQLADDFMTGKNFSSLINYAYQDKDMNPAVNIIIKLSELHLLTDNVRKIFKGQSLYYSTERILPEQIKCFDFCLDILKRDGLFNSNNVRKLIQVLDYSPELYGGISELSESNILTRDTFILLTRIPRFSRSIVTGLKIFHEFNFLNKVTQDALVSNLKDIKFITLSVKLLFESDILDHEINKQCLLDNIQYLKPITSGVIILFKNHCLSQSNFDLLVRCPKFSDNFAQCIGMLSKAGCFLPDPIINILLLYPSSLKYLSISLQTLSEHHMLTQNNVNFLLRKEFRTCFPSVARTMVLLDTAGVLNESNKDRLLKYPHHALLLAKELAVDWRRDNAIDKQLFNLNEKCRVLGEGRRDNNHVFSKFDPSVLSTIAFLSTEGNIDEKTALVTGVQMLEKPKATNTANYKRRFCMIASGMCCAIASSVAVFQIPQELYTSGNYVDQSLERSALLLSFFFMGMVLGIYAGVLFYNRVCKYHPEEKVNRENAPL